MTLPCPVASFVVSDGAVHSLGHVPPAYQYTPRPLVAHAVWFRSP